MEEFFSSALAAKLRNFAWKPWHAHRLLTHRSEPIAERLARLRALHAKTILGDAQRIGEILSRLLDHLTFGKVSDAVAAGFSDLLIGLANQNNQHIVFPEIELRSWTAAETAAITDILDELETRIRYDSRIREYFLEGVARLIILYRDHLLPEPVQSPFSVPLFTCADPAAVIGHAIAMFTDELIPEADSIRALAFYETRKQLFENALAISRLTVEQYEKMPYKVVLPADSDLDPETMLHRYLGGTPLAAFLETPVPFALPQSARFEHCHIIGGTGHGKTQLLQSLALADLDDPAAPAVVVIDSQGDMVRKLAHLARFADSDRLVIVDPSDTEFPLALNIFDIQRERLDTLSLGARDQILAGIIELYDYIFGAIGADLTQKQSVVFRYITRLMLDIPKANIQTLRQLMEDERPFKPYIERLTGTTRAFFENEFSDKSFAATKQQIRRRLYGILSNPTFERIFSSDRNKLDMAAALNSGKVVLVSTAKDVLKSEASSFFGRYMIALVMQAVFERAAVPERDRRPAFLYIDEAADYFDDNIDTLLIQARKYRLGVTLAHQFLDQLTPSLRASVMTNPAIRFAGGVSRKDANALDSDMRTTADFLMGMRKRSDATEFACYVRNVTAAAAKLSIPLGAVEREPRMTVAEYEGALGRSRALVAETRHIATASTLLTIRPTTPPTSSPASQPPAHDPSRSSPW